MPLETVADVEWPVDVADALSPSTRRLGHLLVAARAALFQESVEAGDPELMLSIAAVAARLADEPRSRGLVETAFEEYRLARTAGAPARDETVAAFRGVVSALPAYSR
jgi:hypothetical protein